MDKHLKAINILSIIVIALFAQSCKTTEKFVMSAPADIQISSPIPGSTALTDDGKNFKMTVPADAYCGFVLVKPDKSNLQIPIGVDYRKDNHRGDDWILYGPLLGGAIGYGMCASETLFVPGMILGSLGIGIGGSVGLGIVAGRQLQLSYEYKFGYIKDQKIKIPSLSPTLLHPNKPKEFVLSAKDIIPARSKASSGDDKVNYSDKFTKVNSNHSNYANKVVGEYVGSGVLLKGKDIDENFPEITVILNSKKKNQVLVRIIESGEDFFDTELIYDIKKDKEGNYKLTMMGMPKSTITISKEGILTFTNDKVNIDNSIFTLSIKARIQQ